MGRELIWGSATDIVQVESLDKVVSPAKTICEDESTWAMKMSVSASTEPPRRKEHTGLNSSESEVVVEVDTRAALADAQDVA